MALAKEGHSSKKAHKPITAYLLQPEQLLLPQPIEQSPQPSAGQNSPQPEQASQLLVQSQWPQDIEQSQPGQSQSPVVGQDSPQQVLPLQVVLRGIESLKAKRYVHQKVGCPRCGEVGRVYIAKRGRREYVYVKHGRRDCYLGPARGYIVVQRVHGPLSLTSLNDVNYAEVVASAAEKMLNQIRRAIEGKNMRRVEEIIDAMTDIAYVIRDACHSVEEKRSLCLEEVARALFS